MGFVLPIALVFTACEDDDPKSSLTGLTNFSFMADSNIPGLENIQFTIDQTNHTITNADELPYMTDVSALVAEFEAIDNTIVTVGTVEQVSGVTENDFSSPVNYIVTAEDGVTQITYQVIVNVSQVNPEGVSWVKEQAAVTGDKYETVKSIYFNGKHRAIFGSLINKVATTKYYVSEDGKSWTEASIDEANFPVGKDHGLVVNNGKMYICGYLKVVDPWGLGDPAYYQPGNPKEIWVSADGETFTKAESTYTFDGDKVRSSIFSFNNNIWVVGGNKQVFSNYEGGINGDNHMTGPQSLSDKIHSTADGSTWTDHSEVLPAAEPDNNVEGALRRYAASVVHGDKMFMIGGQIGNGALSNEVWSSADGLIWSKVVPTGLTPRMGAAAISYDNKIWLIGGQTALGVCTSEILVSEDNGATWTAPEEDALLPAEFTPRAGHSAYLDSENKVWIVGGYSAVDTSTENAETGEMKYSEERTSLNDVWSGKLNKL